VTVTNITALGGLAGVIFSIALLVWQTRAVATQTKISNAIAGASIIENSMSDLREILLLFVERPELRAYFYEHKSTPSRGRQRSSVISVAEMFGDVLETGLVANRLVESSESFEDWVNYCQQMDQGEVPAAQALQGHEARLGPDHRPDAGAAAPLALGNRGLVLASRTARARGAW
jgi:hypothetical protein